MTEGAHEEMRVAASYHERWRFRKQEVLPAVPLCDYLDTCADVGLAPLGGSAALWSEEADRLHVPGRPRRRTRLEKSLGDTRLSPAQSCVENRDFEEVRDDAAVPPLADAWAEPSRWKTLFERVWSNKEEHINSKEARVMLTGLRRASRIPACHGSKLLSFSDSLVSCCAFDRGRGRGAERTGWAMKHLAQRSAALQIACNNNWCVRHLELQRNFGESVGRRLQL